MVYQPLGADPCPYIISATTLEIWRNEWAWLLPSPKADSLAGLSFISVTTGLNLALVKFELFRKSYKDIKEWLAEQHDDILGKKVRELIGFDDAAIEDYRNFVVAKLESIAGTCHDTQYKYGLRFRRWAISYLFIGLFALFTQWSLGFLGLALLIPVFSLWCIKTRATKKFSRDSHIYLEMAEDLKKQINAEQTAKAVQAATLIESAVPKPRTPRKPPAKTKRPVRRSASTAAKKRARTKAKGF